MADKSRIEWTDATWNPIVGCSVVSPGCTNCYAMKFAHRFHAVAGSKYEGLTKQTKGGPVWNGRVHLDEKSLTQPLLWKRGRKIFVNSMGDLFHESIPDEWIDKIFAVMDVCPHHIFQVLTKRAERMRDYLNRGQLQWPLPNVWLGVSVEDQRRADERIPALLETPAAVRFVSCEPLLGPVDFLRIKLKGENDGWNYETDALSGRWMKWRGEAHPQDWMPGKTTGEAHIGSITQLNPVLDWVIAGGESGPGARPMHPLWAESLRDQCQSSGVPFFFKQWGAWAPAAHIESVDSKISLSIGRQTAAGYTNRVHTNIDGSQMAKVGKKSSGRLLDGREWNEFPRDLFIDVNKKVNA